MSDNSDGTYAQLRAQTRNDVLEITIVRPERRNALTAAMVSKIRSLITEAEERPDLRSILITGYGTAFCAGFDIGDIQSPGSESAGLERDLVNDLATATTESPIPVVAAINGFAVGAGCDLALACDIRVGSPGASFSMPPAKLGILYAWPGMERLLRAVGFATASEMLLTGDMIHADRALAIGLLSRIAAHDDLIEEARSLCRRLADNSPVSMQASKESLRLLAKSQLDDRDLGRLARIQEEVWTSSDAKEGAQAYREGRKPTFVGLEKS